MEPFVSGQTFHYNLVSTLFKEVLPVSNSEKAKNALVTAL